MTKKNERQPRKPVRELFAEAAKTNRVTPISRLVAVAKKAGIENFDNRFYHFRKTGASKLGLKVVYDADKETVKLVKGPMFKKPAVKKAAAKKSAKKVATKKKVAAKKPAAKPAVHHNPQPQPVHTAA